MKKKTASSIIYIPKHKRSEKENEFVQDEAFLITTSNRASKIPIRIPIPAKTVSLKVSKSFRIAERLITIAAVKFNAAASHPNKMGMRSLEGLARIASNTTETSTAALDININKLVFLSIWGIRFVFL